MDRILIVNGSVAGSIGNCANLTTHLTKRFEGRVQVDVLHLAESTDCFEWESRIRDASGFVFITGVYWDSWGSPLQRFLETQTHLEASDAWLGKPASVLVTMHSIGGKAVLSRLQGVLNTLGLMIPPLTGWVYSAANQEILSHNGDGVAEDLWRIDDLAVICHNLLQAVRGGRDWHAWPVDRRNFDAIWLQCRTSPPRGEPDEANDSGIF